LKKTGLLYSEIATIQAPLNFFRKSLETSKRAWYNFPLSAKRKADDSHTSKAERKVQKMRVARRLKTALCCVGLFGACLFSASYGADLSEIASKLCRSGGGDWTRVVPIVVENPTSAPYEERVVGLPIKGDQDAPVEGALPFVGERAESIRVCDESGVEYVFNVVRPDGSFVDKGVIGEGCELNLPATIEPSANRLYYVFAGNDRAYPNPDRLSESRKTLQNLDFEQGDGSVPTGWVFDVSGENRALTWTTEEPASGRKCVRCDVAPCEKPSWIAARQTSVAIEPGARYRFEARVRGQNVSGNAGWYLHFGNSGQEMISSPMLYAPKTPNFDWTTVSGEFVAPENADLLSFGTVLYGTGVAWFDAASLTRLDGETSVSTIRVEDEIALETPESVYPSLNANEQGAPVFDPTRLGVATNARMATIRIDAPVSGGKRLIGLDLRALETRWGRRLGPTDFDVLDLNAQSVEKQFFDGSVFFVADVKQGARNYFVVVEKNGKKKAPDALSQGKNVANQAFPGTMLQSTNAEKADDAQDAPKDAGLRLPPFLQKLNLLTDGDFENVDPKTLEETTKNADGRAWTRDASEPGVRFSIVDPGLETLGKRSLKVEVDETAETKWRGWRRVVDVTPGQTYLIGYAVKCDSKGGSYDLHFHWRQDDGSLAAAGMNALGKAVSGKTEWTLKFGFSRASFDATKVELHLTNQTRGTSEYDSVFITPIDRAEPVEFIGGKSGVFQVPAIAKVFRDTTFSENEQEISDARPATCALALDEEETLQLAFRAVDDARYTVDASAPVAPGSNEKLEAPEVFAVGNVIVDYPSSYYQEHGAETTRKFPQGTHACDGWIGLWPDPLIPLETASRNDGVKVDASKFGAKEIWNDSQRLAVEGAEGVLTLRKDETRAIWLRFRTTKETKPGLYEGAVVLRDAKGETTSIPYVVEVLGFVAPETKVAAIYDARVAKDYFKMGSYTEVLRKVADKLLERKLSPDQPVASPTFSYDAESGVATADWTEYDKQASRYFDELGGKVAYFPGEFYLFGWGVPPKVVAGENPYPGEWPYEGADRSQLRPEYKRAYQAKLKLFWEHLKEKGWADKTVLYISDEPFYSNPEIIAQMKALCDMIHEVDPKIPIYASTWVFVPEWLNYIDVWGVGHYGGVDETALKTIKDAGGRIWWTTDGQMCLDTPLCAVERLLPYTCVARGAEVYEFWGATWFTCDPFESASHLYIHQSDQPGVHYFVRYPNGDGYIFYPGDLIGRPNEILDSIRSEQAREGIEDAGWLVGLQNALAEKTSLDSNERAEAQKTLDRALNYLPLQCGCGRYSTRYVSDPAEFEQIRLDVGRELEKLSNAR